MSPKLSLLIIIIGLHNLTAFTQDFTLAHKAVASDRAATDWFGLTVSISGNYAIVGAENEDEDTLGENTMNNAGSAYILERNAEGNWHEKQKLVASDRAEGDYFSNAADISGNYAIVGANYEDEDAEGNNTFTDAGSAYIFERDGSGNWTEVQKIVSAYREPGATFGNAVCISSTIAVVGAPNEGTDILGGNIIDDAGAAYVFERDVNGIWNVVYKLVASDRSANAAFGCSVSTYGKYIAVGAYFEDNDSVGENPIVNSGAVYIFEQDGDGDWNEVQKIVASDREAEAYFGASLSLNGNYIFVGAPWEEKDVAGENPLELAGAIYVFARDENSNWNEVQKLVASDRDEWYGFGITVEFSGDRAIIGGGYESESAYIFEQGSNGTWSETQKIIHPDIQIDDWVSVAISGDYLIIGAPKEEEDASGENAINGAGAALIFESCTPGSATDPENIIENGDFEECILSPWSVFNYYFYGVTAEAVLTDGKCTVTNISISDDPVIFQVQLQQVLTGSQVDRLEVGATYELSFEAYAPTARQCRVSFEQAVDPWNGIFNTTIELGTAPADYSYEFTLDNMYENMQLVFQLGNENTPATLDNVRLVKKHGNSVADKLYDNEIIIMPNPATDIISVKAGNGARLRVYNNVGVTVLENIIQPGTVELDISELTKGIYYLEITQDDNLYIHKVIKN